MTGWSRGGGVTDTLAETLNSLVYFTGPLRAATEISGLFRGHLELVTNNRDFDFSISIFELREDGTYFQIPPYQSCAKYLADPTTPHPLTSGRCERFDFTSIRLAAICVAPAAS
jgi:uncharacterized protein